MSTKIFFSYEIELWDTKFGGEGNYTLTGAFLHGGKFDASFSDDTIVAGDTVYVVYVAYDTGGTFGTEGGYGEIIAVTKDEAKAQSVLKWIETKIEEDKQIRYHSRARIRHKKKFSIPPWPSSVQPAQADIEPVNGKFSPPTYLCCLGFFEFNQRPRLANFVVQP